MEAVRNCKLERLSAQLAQLQISKATFRRWIRAGLYPEPVKLGLGQRISVWPAEEGREVRAAMVAGASADEIRTLVRNLIARRVAA